MKIEGEYHLQNIRSKILFTLNTRRHAIEKKQNPLIVGGRQEVHATTGNRK